MLSGPRLRPRERHEAQERVTFPASSSTKGPRCGISRTRSSRESDLAPSLCRLPPTEASRPGRLMRVTACQDPHEAPGTPGTQLGRPPPAPDPRRPFPWDQPFRSARGGRRASRGGGPGRRGPRGRGRGCGRGRGRSRRGRRATCRRCPRGVGRWRRRRHRGQRRRR